MKMHRLFHAALLASVLVTAAACGDSKPPDDTPDAGQPDGGGNPDPIPTDPNDPNNAIKDTDCDGLSDKEEFETIYGGGRKTNPGLADTDGDGLPDGLEVGDDQAVPGTNCVVTKDESAFLKTDPTLADTDGDGLKDGVEDANKNGKVDSNETNPVLKDSDCDGLIDGPTAGGTKGEDQNANGVKDTGETDPRLADTDGDGILDGIESGVTVNPDPTTCTNFKPDANPSTTTDPTNSDSDGDGVNDGAEDTNQNGGVDSGELNPNDGADASGPVGQVCTESKLRPVSFKSEDGPDIKLALPPTFLDADVVQIKSGNDVKGLVGYDSTNKVAFLVYRQAAPTNATDASKDETALRTTIATKGALTNPTVQRFRTWDDNDAAQAFYDQAGGSTDLKARTNELVDALVPGSSGRLSSTPAGISGNFRLQSLYVHRSNQSVVVLVAVTQLNSTNPAAVFSAKDLSDGSALAQFGEPTAVQCERFQLSTSKVDFLFVVDDSGSMGSSQQALGVAAQAAVDALNNTSLDWRMAMVSSNYHYQESTSNPNYNKLRKFTRNVNTVRAWLTQGSTCQNNVCSGVPTTPQTATCSTSDTSQGANNGCWVSISGTGAEGVLGSARKAINDMTPGTSASEPESDTKARADASLVVIVLGDADDQTKNATTSVSNCGAGGTVDKPGSECEAVANFVNFFGNVSSNATPTNPTSKLIPVHAIVCPEGTRCACDANGNNCEFNPQPANGGQRHRAVASASGGVVGSITDQTSIKNSVDAIISSAIGNAGYKTLKPPIGASIKVAVDSVNNAASCNKDDIPRSTMNGFDFDGRARTISLFGACRPASQTSQAAVSYRYWINSVSDPNGGVPCEDDPNYSPTEPDHCAGPKLECNGAGNQCVCKSNCGNTCGAGTQCDMNTCSCEIIIG
ncbi:adventurous gliding motility lipoprotein CglD [Hyalangium versicolor]|uniref:adventurous gliding motility lipoprotein CglD n=1 Tax=Hyalangium versicolor TaxID=2861190 RepID=UPI001CC98271|nr:adventurous gliding motility lipoprotein CglD [Hyalangium versicolor]